MQNFVPLGTGNSRLMKSSIPAGTTWEQALAMLRGGTFPYDTGQLNPAGISQQGDPLNKDTLLKDATAALYGLGTDAVPDEVQAMLSGSIQYSETQEQVPDLPEVGISLEAATWEQIRNVANAGLASTYWSVGDTKSISFELYTMYVQIIGFDHDDLTTPQNGRTKAGITFQLGLPYGTQKSGLYPGSQYQMNTSFTNTGGWGSSTIRTSTIQTMESWLPSELQSVLSVVNKQTSSGGQSSAIQTTQDKLFLLSSVEVNGGNSYTPSGEGETYALYSGASDSDRVRTDGDNNNAMSYWLRSPNINSDNQFCYVTASGNVSSIAPTNQLYITFGFCVGGGEAVPQRIDTIQKLVSPTGTNVTDQVAQALGSVKVETGSYTGTGTYGESNPTVINFSASVAMLVLPGYGTDAANPTYNLPHFNGTSISVLPPENLTKTLIQNTTGNDNQATITWNADKTSVSIYANSAVGQRNQQNYLYYYIALTIAGGES